MESETAQLQKCSCKCHKHAVAIFAVLLIAGVACWYIHHPNRPRAYPTVDPKPGQYCTVMLCGFHTAFSGTVIATHREAILLQADKRVSKGDTPLVSHAGCLWIPKTSILLIECNAPRLQE